MKRAAVFLAVFAAAFSVFAFLPVSVSRSMRRSQTAGGDLIDWTLNFRSLESFRADYDYFRPEENFALWLLVSIALNCFYALVVAFAADFLFNWRRRKI